MLLPRKIAGLASTVVLTSLLAFGQGGNPSGGSTGTSTPSTPPPQVRDQRPVTRPVILSGRVMIDDGSPLPDRAVIERVCGGRTVREANTDTQGYFSFEVGRETRFFQDASSNLAAGAGLETLRGTGSVMSSAGPSWDGMRNETSGGPLQTCELRASLAGFRSDSLILAGRTFSHPDVGTIVLHRMGKVQGSTISVTTMQAPKAAKNAFQRARNAADKQKWQEAQEQLQEAVRIYPKYAAAWLDLGMLESKANHKAEAQKAFEQALAADPDYIPSYYQLAALAAQAKQWERVAELTDKALALNSYEFAPLYLYNGVAYLNLRKLDKAEASARAARRLDSQYKFPAIDLLLGQILAERQDFGGAAEQLRSFLKHAPNAPQAEQVRAQLTSLEKQAAATKNP